MPKSTNVYWLPSQKLARLWAEASEFPSMRCVAYARLYRRLPDVSAISKYVETYLHRTLELPTGDHVVYRFQRLHGIIEIPVSFSEDPLKLLQPKLAALPKPESQTARLELRDQRSRCP